MLDAQFGMQRVETWRDTANNNKNKESSSAPEGRHIAHRGEQLESHACRTTLQHIYSSNARASASTGELRERDNDHTLSIAGKHDTNITTSSPLETQHGAP
jgi:hypothetical protein